MAIEIPDQPFLSNPDPALKLPVSEEMAVQEGIQADEFATLCRILGRIPNITELGIFGVMWSEHCAYKNSKRLLATFPTEKGDRNAPGQVIVKAGEENAGVIDIGDGWAIAFKIESHNHPSAIEPFEGAATGVGGIIRDIFTMGARPVLMTNSLRFGDLDSEEVRRHLRGVVQGISHYGNCVGIPNVGGDVYFDDCYRGNPLVNALCLGIVRGNAIKRGRASGVGNPVYYVGAPTGRDGLGGASFASKVLSQESHADRPAVQKGDPFMEKLLLEACLEMMAVPGLVVGIQDMGAAGLTCSSCETASRGESGVDIDLDRVPQRETGMNSYEIMLSESQERMLVIARQGREAELEEIFEKWDLHAAKIGEVTPDGLMSVHQGGMCVASIPAGALTDESPVYDREARAPKDLRELQRWDANSLPEPTPEQISEALPRLLSHPTIACKRWIWQQYDHMVMSGTALPPGSDAAIVRVRLGQGIEKFIAIANDCNNRYCRVHPYRGGMIAVAECIRNLVCSGARPLGMTNCLNFGNPYSPDVYFALSECVRGLAEACRYFDVPVVGGNVSLYNENENGAIDPTPVVAIAGLVERPEMITRQTVRHGCEELILLGGMPYELGASYYLEVIHGLLTGNAPNIDLEEAARLHATVLRMIAEGWVVAAHDLSEGGLLVALAEMLFASKATFGAEIALPRGCLDRRWDSQLFGESQNRIILAILPEAVGDVMVAARRSGIPSMHLGQVEKGGQIRIRDETGTTCLEWDAEVLRSAWESAIPSAMEPA